MDGISRFSLGKGVHPLTLDYEVGPLGFLKLRWLAGAADIPAERLRALPMALSSAVGGGGAVQVTDAVPPEALCRYSTSATNAGTGVQSRSK